jgi:hypothetical protein
MIEGSNGLNSGQKGLRKACDRISEFGRRKVEIEFLYFET